MAGPARKSLGASLFTDDERLRTRLYHFVEAVEAVAPRQFMGTTWLLGATDHVLREVGLDLRSANYLTLADIFEMRGVALPEGTAASLVLAGAWHALRNQIDEHGKTAFMTPAKYEEGLNKILAEEKVAFRLRGGAWVGAGLSDTEALRRVLLENADEAVACKQGDVQVEMVVSTVQTKLSEPGAVVVDYGAGVGRVLAGLATAENFKKAVYIAVDEPMPPAVKALAGHTGAKSEFIESRDGFLASKREVDAIMIVNTLHHVPFRDIARQLGALLGMLRPGGFLLVHEMGALRNPEQRNVPWRMEHLLTLFQGEEFTCNPRSTESRSGVPLCHAIVRPTGKGGAVADALARSVPAVWRQMKDQALEAIAALYAEGEPNQHAALQHELITNANLDLNRP